MDLCPTLDMIGDYFTKALHGSQFCCFCYIILGIHEDEIPSYNASRRTLIQDKYIKYRSRNKRIISLPKLQATKATKECVG